VDKFALINALNINSERKGIQHNLKVETLMQVSIMANTLLLSVQNGSIALKNILA